VVKLLWDAAVYAELDASLSVVRQGVMMDGVSGSSSCVMAFLRDVGIDAQFDSLLSVVKQGTTGRKSHR
jgi:hypothetical protein